ncbi:hypothetical protein CFE90_12170 [Listeria monocytogenes]|nr:hypothetical protein [Listeria monocytogenes]EAC4149170.1 hypothetical protein [Listeria monocytogenes]EAC7138858.1 hypothetical protein [Listeria monocytogenes]EAD2461450.1 hypothetical protein [Listeria monocytogenes]EAD3338940.1 hypothetical protein [Listeria monocytogenes]
MKGCDFDDLSRSRDKKWQVFFLSEHNEQMDQQQESSRLKWREAMSSECIESVLSAAITHPSSLAIQKKPLIAEIFFKGINHWQQVKFHII